MPEKLRPLRRILTGHDAQGRSVIVEDGSPRDLRTMPEREGYQVANMWVTTDTPAKLEQADLSAEHKGVAPPKRGTVVRVIDIPPEPDDPEELERAVGAVFKAHFDDAHRSSAEGGKPKHPGMHKTDTIDYAILIEGELTAIMDEGETVMRPGDVLIQRGTNHAWSNRSGRMCRIAFILVDAE
ncbi:MAG: cupin domain-containing protein [Ectothiorhodospiraceae bacterium]|nr:cupin domain-containing protein [Ectothiorhodospiraceae bacterium]